MVAEHEYNVPDRLAGYEAVAELRRCCPGREFRFVLVNVTYAVRRPVPYDLDRLDRKWRGWGILLAFGARQTNQLPLSAFATCSAWR